MKPKINNALRTVSNMHFNPSKYLKGRLGKENTLHENDLEKLTEGMLHLIGESTFIRNYLDDPSQKINKAFKNSVLKPASDHLLDFQQSFNKEENIENSLESMRKYFRFGMRRLSMINPNVAPEDKLKLAKNHTNEITNQANKILTKNIENILVSNSHNLSQDNITHIKSLISTIPTFNSSSIENKNPEDLKSLEDNMETLESQLTELLEAEQTRIKEAFEIHKKGLRDSDLKLQSFKEEIEKMEDLKKDHPIENVKYEYALLRSIYASEWVARVSLLNPISTPASDFIIQGLGASSGTESNFIKIILKQGLTSTAGHALNRGFYVDIKEELTSSKGAEETNDNNDNKKETYPSGYFVFFDTESHDYLKFIIRLTVAHLASDLFANEEIDPSLKEFAESFTKSVTRFVSGSHIAMRMEVKEKLLDPLFDHAVSMMSSEQSIENTKSSSPSEPTSQLLAKELQELKTSQVLK